MVSLEKFVRSTPEKVLREFLRRNGIEAAGVSGRTKRQNTQPFVDAIARSNESSRTRVANDAERIMNLADEVGQVALYSTIRDHSKLDALENGQARSVYVFMHDPEAFRRAEEVRYTDERRRGRMWDGYVAAAALEVRRQGDVVELFKAAVRKHFDTQNVHIDVFDRTRIGSDGMTYVLVQATVYRDGRPDTVLEFIDGELGRRSIRPAIEAALTYEPATGVIEVVAGAKDARLEFVRLFADNVLGVEVGQNRLPLRRYDLAMLLRPHGFPTDPEDGIDGVRVTLLRLMPLGTSGERLTLECMRGAATTIWQMAASHFGSANPLTQGWVVTQARLAIKFNSTPTMPRGRSLPLTISMPNGCDLKDRTESERLVGDKYLRRWGILEDA